MDLLASCREYVDHLEEACSYKPVDRKDAWMALAHAILPHARGKSEETK